MNKQETLMSPDTSQLNQLSCLKLFRQIQLICAPISMDKTEYSESQTQGVDNFHRFLTERTQLRLSAHNDLLSTRLHDSHENKN